MNNKIPTSGVFPLGKPKFVDGGSVNFYVLCAHSWVCIFLEARGWKIFFDQLLFS